MNLYRTFIVILTTLHWSHIQTFPLTSTHTFTHWCAEWICISGLTALIRSRLKCYRQKLESNPSDHLIHKTKQVLSVLIIIIFYLFIYCKICIITRNWLICLYLANTTFFWVLAPTFLPFFFKVYVRKSVVGRNHSFE